MASYVVLNREGWILTAHHVLRMAQELIQGAAQYADRDRQRAEIAQNVQLSEKEKSRQMRAIQKTRPDDTQHAAVWWALDGMALVESHSIEAADIAVARLAPFDPSWISEYPSLIETTKELQQGRSLCRLGFPFNTVVPTFDDKTKQFGLPPGTALAVFPIEGIYTRTGMIGTHPNGFPVAFLETSSPGLRGQSGGPIVDRNGTLWSIQSNTEHLSLGFDPPVPGGKSGQREHQFLNVGRGTHPATIRGLLDEKGISYTVSQQ